MLPPRAIADVRAGGLRHRTGQPSQAREFGLGRLASHSSARAMDATGPRTSGFQPTPQARHARPRWRQGKKLVPRKLVASLLATGERYQLIPSPRNARAHRADTCAACLAPSIRTVSPTAGIGLASLLRLHSLSFRYTDFAPAPLIPPAQIWRDRSTNAGCPNKGRCGTHPRRWRGSRRRTLTALAFSRNARPGLRPGLAPDSALRASRGSNRHFVPVLADLASRRDQNGATLRVSPKSGQ